MTFRSDKRGPPHHLVDDLVDLDPILRVDHKDELAGHFSGPFSGHFQTIFSPFLGMAGHGRSWLSVAGQCQPLPKMAGHGWLAAAGHGWLRLALVSAVGVKWCQWIINYSPHRV